MLDDEIHTLAYFHKDSVTSCEEIEKIVIKKIVKRLHVSNRMNLLVM